MRTLLLAVAALICMTSFAGAQPACAPFPWCASGNWLDKHCWCYRYRGPQWPHRGGWQGGERWGDDGGWDGDDDRGDRGGWDGDDDDSGGWNNGKHKRGRDRDD